MICTLNWIFSPEFSEANHPWILLILSHLQQTAAHGSPYKNPDTRQKNLFLTKKMYKERILDVLIYVSPISFVSSCPSFWVYALYDLLMLEHSFLCTSSVGLVIAFVKALKSGCSQLQALYNLLFEGYLQLLTGYGSHWEMMLRETSFVLKSSCQRDQSSQVAHLRSLRAGMSKVLQTLSALSVISRMTLLPWQKLLYWLHWPDLNRPASNYAYVMLYWNEV